MTPLLMAASTCQSQLVKALVVIRADAGAKTFDGKTILDLTSKNSMGLCKWLGEHAKTKDGAKLGWQTPADKAKAKDPASSQSSTKAPSRPGKHYKLIRQCISRSEQLSKKGSPSHRSAQASSQAQGKGTDWTSSSSWWENSSWGQGSGWWGN